MEPLGPLVVDQARLLDVSHPGYMTRSVALELGRGHSEDCETSGGLLHRIIFVEPGYDVVVLMA